VPPLLKVAWQGASHGEGAAGGLPTVWARWEASMTALTDGAVGGLSQRHDGRPHHGGEQRVVGG
jgi:hypothetical protein